MVKQTDEISSSRKLLLLFISFLIIPGSFLVMLMAIGALCVFLIAIFIHKLFRC